MIVLIPIFLDEDDDVYIGELGHELICLFIEAVIAAKLIKKIIVITNKEEIYGTLNKFKNETFIVKICKKTEMENSNLLPLGSDSAIQCIKKDIAKNSTLMILSFRNPLMTSNLLDKAISQFLNLDMNLLISVKESTDHPCQLSTYYKIIDINAVFIIDTEVDKRLYYNELKPYFDKFAGKDLFVTYSFYFDWNSKKISTKSACGVYFRQPAASERGYIPIESLTGKDNLFFEDYDFIVSETKSSARLLSCNKKTAFKPQQGVECSVGGISLSESTNVDFLLIKNKNNKYFICVNKSLKYNETYILKIHKITKSLQKDVFSIDMIIDGKKPLYEISTDMSDATGIIFSILKYSENDDCDLVVPFEPTKSLWYFNELHSAINRTTGKRITGRQEFPETFEPEGSFFIMKQEESKNLIRGIINKNSNAYVLKENESVQIKSKIEYMDYRAIFKSRTQESIQAHCLL